MKEYTVFIPEGKYPMVWSLDDWCSDNIGKDNWMRRTKWDKHAFAPRPLGQIYSFKTEADSILFTLKWS